MSARQRTLLLTAGMLLAAAAPVIARVGGGQSYGGGGGSRSGGGGGGGGDAIFFLIELLFRLIFAVPSIGIPVLIALIVLFAWGASQQGAQQYSTDAAPPPEAFDAASPAARAALEKVDPNFSQTLFIDFVQLLYERFQNERAGRTAADGAVAADGGPSKGLTRLAPWFTPAILAEAEADAARRGIVKVGDVLVGSSHIASIDVGAEQTCIDVMFEANFTEWTAQQQQPPLYVTERWSFSRRTGVLSKGPGDITAFTCPSCGSPSELKPDGTCPYCGQVVNHGDFQWLVTATRVVQAVPRPPVDLVGGGLLGGGYEAGTDLPTVFAPDFEAARRAFTVRNPDFSWGAFEQRVRAIFIDLQQAWSGRQWAKARPFETDALFNRHRYWMDMYARQGLTNKLEDIEIRRVVPVRFGQDAFFDIVTVRIFASMRDFTVNAGGQPVSGDPRTPRPFSEYWTFIRRATAKGPASPRGQGACPNCGAPLEVSMAGDCAYCGGKVTSGDFDWVLSSIEQDEAYRG